MPRPVFDRPIAHRGLHDRRKGVIENSRSAFAAALDAGFAIECDLQLTSDGVPIVFHDYDLKRLTGREGRVRETSSSALAATPLLDSAAGDCPQTFADFLQQVGQGVTLQVELKPQAHDDTPRLAEAAARIAASYQGPLTFESFDPQLIAQVRRAGFSGPTGIAVERFDGDDEETRALTKAQRFNLRHLIHAPWSRFDFISCDKTALDMPAVRFFRRLGLPVTTWTVRSQSEARAAAPYSDQIVFEGFDPR